MINEELAHLYLKTIVYFEEDGKMIPASESSVATTSKIHVITAWNPGDDRPNRKVNGEANERLRQKLRQRGCRPVRAIGADPDSDHLEESWAVTGLDDGEARAIGAEFGQVAIFRIAAGIQTVLACTAYFELSRPL